MKINCVKKITDCKHLNLFSISYKDRTERDREWIFASRSPRSNPLEHDQSSTDAVVVVPYHKNEGKLVLIKEFRVALGDYQYGFPAGLLDKGESVEDAEFLIISVNIPTIFGSDGRPFYMILPNPIPKDLRMVDGLFMDTMRLEPKWFRRFSVN